MNSETRLWIARVATWLVAILLVLLLGWRAIAWLTDRDVGALDLWALGILIAAGLFLYWCKRWADF